MPSFRSTVLPSSSGLTIEVARLNNPERYEFCLHRTKTSNFTQYNAVYNPDWNTSIFPGESYTSKSSSSHAYKVLSIVILRDLHI